MSKGVIDEITETTGTEKDILFIERTTHQMTQHRNYKLPLKTRKKSKEARGGSTSRKDRPKPLPSQSLLS
jgi:hypothetical protein